MGQGMDAPVYCCCLLRDERLQLRGLQLRRLHLENIILLLLLFSLLPRILCLQHSLVLGLLCVWIESGELRLNRGRIIH